MGHSILGRMDDMGTRMDELEQSIAALLQQAGLDQNGFSSNTSFDTTASFTSQAKTNSLRVSSPTPLNNATASNKTNTQNKIQTPLGTAMSPKTSASTSVSIVNDSTLQLSPSLTRALSPTQQVGAATPARARVTIEI